MVVIVFFPLLLVQAADVADEYALVEPAVLEAAADPVMTPLLILEVEARRDKVLTAEPDSMCQEVMKVVVEAAEREHLAQILLLLPAALAEPENQVLSQGQQYSMQVVEAEAETLELQAVLEAAVPALIQEQQQQEQPTPAVEAVA
jgi:hypothetical protein